MYRGWTKLWRKGQDSEVFANERLWKLWTLCLMKANYKEKTIILDGTVKAVIVKPGQFITGRYQLHATYHQRRKGYKHRHPSPSTLWRWLQTLEKMGNLTIQSFNKYSVITITNWEDYQGNTECSIKVFQGNQGLSADFERDFSKKMSNLNIKKEQLNNAISASCKNEEHKSEQHADIRRTSDEHNEEGIKKKVDGSGTLLFSCSLFSIPESYYQKLQQEYPGITRERIINLCSKIEDYCTDDPRRYKRDKQGRLKSPRNVLRNWLERELKDHQESEGRAYKPFTEEL